MDSVCYGRVLGTELGPMSFADLRHMAQVGELSSDDEIKIGDDGDWVPAQTLPELFTDGPQDSAERSSESQLAQQKPLDQHYYCQLLGSELGPIDFHDLKQMAINGELSESDPVRLETEAQWQEARLIANLFEPTASQSQHPGQTDEWYCQVLGNELGPLRLTDLITMIQNGELNEQDPVRPGKTQEWCGVHDIELLQNELLSREAAIMTNDIAVPSKAQTDQEDDEFQLAEDVTTIEAGPSHTDHQPVSDQASQTERPAELAASWDAATSEDDAVSDELLSDLDDMVTGLTDDEETDEDTDEKELAGADAAAASEGWYVQGAGKVELGPMNLEQLQEMVAKKQVLGHQKIKSGQRGEWFPSGDLGQFLKSINVTDRLKPVSQFASAQPERPTKKANRAKSKRNLLAPVSEAFASLKARFQSTDSGKEKVNYFYANPVLLTVFTLAVGIWALQFVTFDVSDEVYLAQLNELYNESRSLLQESGTPEDWNRLVSKAERLVKSIENGLANKATADNPAQICILRAARDYLVPMVKAMRTNSKKEVLRFERQLREARAHLDGDRRYFERRARESEAGQQN